MAKDCSTAMKKVVESVEERISGVNRQLRENEEKLNDAIKNKDAPDASKVVTAISEQISYFNGMLMSLTETLVEVKKYCK